MYQKIIFFCAYFATTNFHAYNLQPLTNHVLMTVLGWRSVLIFWAWASCYYSDPDSLKFRESHQRVFSKSFWRKNQIRRPLSYNFRQWQWLLLYEWKHDHKCIQQRFISAGSSGWQLLFVCSWKKAIEGKVSVKFFCWCGGSAEKTCRLIIIQIYVGGLELGYMDVF